MEFKKSLGHTYFFSKILKSNRMRFFAVTIIFWMILFFGFSSTLDEGKYDYIKGDIAREDIVIKSEIIDELATKRLKDKAESEVEPVEYIIPTILVDTKKDVREFFERLYSVRSDFAGDNDVLIQVYTGMEADNLLELTKEELSTLAIMDQRKLEDIETTVNDLVLQMMSAGISEEELKAKREDVQKYLGTLDFDEPIKGLMGKIVTLNLKANRFVDVEATESIVEERRSEVENVVIGAGTMLVPEGGTITTEHIRILELAGLLATHTIEDKLSVYGAFLFTVLIVVGMMLYLNYFQHKVLENIKKLILIFSVFLLIFLTSRVVNMSSPYLVPVALFPMLIGIAVNPSVGIILSALLCVVIAIWNGVSVQALSVMLIACGVGGVSISKVSQRGQLLLAGVYVAIVNVVGIISENLIEGTAILDTVSHLLNGAIGGMLAAVMTLGLLPVIESVFHVLTPMKLLELSNPNHVLLKRLLIEAPGTYHHSILVGNLAEAAAHDIGANSLLARVGAFYHDIGKIERPYYFKENQITAENPHDRLIPAVSASIIKRHATYGHSLGEKHRLPREILDIIGQHHGTTRIQYFYHKACEASDNPDKVRIDDYSYEGPIPQTQEAAIVMLADSVEAAVRSMQEPTHAHIEDMVSKIISGKMAEGQLEASDLTFKDLGVIKGAFMNVLAGIFHERIEYPDLSDFDIRR